MIPIPHGTSRLRALAWRGACLGACISAALAAQEEDVRWLLEFDGRGLPAAPWEAVGEPRTESTAEGLRIVDDSEGFGFFRAPWQPGAEDEEIIVEARLRAGAMTGSVRNKPGTSLWPWRDGAPIMLQVSDGRHHEGLAWFPGQVTTWTDRYIPMNTASGFHTYRLVIRGRDMAVWVDGKKHVTGQGAFWKPAPSREAWLQFGSSSPVATGDAVWASVRLGLRKTNTAPPADPVRISVSEPWDIPRPEVRQTRPYLYDLGRGLMMMSVAQGPDAFYEPYGLLKSTDEGKIWTPIPGLDQADHTPLPVLRRPDGGILAMSRWTWLREDGSVQGKTVRLNADATAFTMEDNRILLPPEYANESKGDQTICERDIWNEADGSVTMVVWSRKAMRQADGRARTMRHSHLMRSDDEGRTWRHIAVIGRGGEPAVARLTDTRWTAVIRGEDDFRMRQYFSEDGGRTWSDAVQLEEGRVLPDLVLMSNGVLACSYGRPASCLMFSLDGGRTWSSHHVISDKTGFNYTGIREIAPGRLLYVHDAPRLQALYVDVEVVRP